MTSGTPSKPKDPLTAHWVDDLSLPLSIRIQKAMVMAYDLAQTGRLPFDIEYHHIPVEVFAHLRQQKDPS